MALFIYTVPKFKLSAFIYSFFKHLLTILPGSILGAGKEESIRIPALKKCNVYTLKIDIDI